VLLRDLPQLIEQQQEDFEAAAPTVRPAIEYGLAILGAFKELHAAAAKADKFLSRGAPSTRTAAWFPDAFWLAIFLRMLGERVSKQIGLTNIESPAVHLIVAAFERALPEERVLAENVAKAMHRHKHLIEPYRP
jgi:hypothetical protein